MESFLATKQTAVLVFFNLCLLLVMFALMRKALRGSNVSLGNRRITIFFMFVFVLFSFWGADWFGYYSSYLTIRMDGNTNLEDIYYWIIQQASPNYLVFRLIVWGGSLLLFIHLVKRLSVPTDLALFLFSTIYIIWFSYARVTLSMVLVYYGLSLFYKPYKSKLLSWVIGIAAIGVSFFFHKTALFAIAISVLVVVSNKHERKFMLASLVLFPLLIIIAQNYLGDFIMQDIDAEDGAASANFAAGQRYLEETKGLRGPGYLIQAFLERTPYFILVYIAFRYVRSKYYMTCPSDIRAFMRLLFYIVVVASLFSFDLSANTRVIFVRFLRFAAIPAVVVLAHFLNVRFYPKLTKCTYWIAFMGTLYAVVYAMYNAYDANGLF